MCIDFFYLAREKTVKANNVSQIKRVCLYSMRALCGGVGGGGLWRRSGLTKLTGGVDVDCRRKRWSMKMS